jgi:DNA adenine methylase
LPFRLKWAGGKRWLADALIASLRQDTFDAGLCEPFAGGAALSFATGRRGQLHLADTNRDLIETYRAIQVMPDSVARGLAELEISPKIFEQIRSGVPKTTLRRAIRTIYLNRTAFNGLWRVNARGRFNVPYGCKPETRLPRFEELQATSAILEGAKLEVADFETAAMSTTSPIVYFDPPYTVSHNNNGFIRYNERIFSWDDQKRLARAASQLAEHGQAVVVSNAFHDDVRELYRGGPFKQYRVSRATNLAARVDRRGAVNELLVVSRDLRFKTLPSFAVRID